MATLKSKDGKRTLIVLPTKAMKHLGKVVKKSVRDKEKELRKKCKSPKSK